MLKRVKLLKIIYTKKYDDKGGEGSGFGSRLGKSSQTVERFIIVWGS